MVEYVPSPKLQFHEVGTYPTLASENWTARGAEPDVIFVVKRETGDVDPGCCCSTVIVWDVDVLVPPVFDVVMVMVYVPAAVYRCDGFCNRFPVVLPSPKFQNHDVGVFVDLSVNCTANGTVPERGLAEKVATGVMTWVTVMKLVLVLVFAPPVFATLRLTLYCRATV